MYCSGNPKTKTELKRRVAAGEQITVYSNAPGIANPPLNGKVFVEGPHAPAFHTWYGTVLVESGVIVKVVE